MRQKLIPDFFVGFSGAEHSSPTEFYPAQVPGAVQLDWARAKDRPPYWVSNNFKEYAFAEDCFWHYTAEFVLENDADQTPYLCFKSIDYQFVIKINGRELLRQEGMFTPVRLNLSDFAGMTCCLEVIVFPTPKREGAEPDTRLEADTCCKPPVAYGWDWHPRLIPLGICDDAYVEYAPRTHIGDFSVTSRVSDDLCSATFFVSVAVINPCGDAMLTITAPDGKTESLSVPAEEELTFTVPVADPALWWCAGQGPQNLYTVTLTLTTSSDQRQERTGLRRIRLVPNAEAWDTQPFPCTQATFPITVELNGREIFAKGTNWVSPEIFTGLIDSDTYRSLLTLARDANMNLLRCWGGSFVNKDSFFEQCDEMGLMVWQEFPLSCNLYPDDPHYLEVLDFESRAIIKRLRHHPCLAIWCGGNELFCSWSGMTNQSLALRLLDKNCYDLCPNVPYLMTSPLYGMGHGGYTLFGDESAPELVTAFVHAGKTAYTEFGSPGPSSKEVLKSFMSEEEYADFDSEVWTTHHAKDAWTYQDAWLRISDINRFYGGDLNFEETLDAGLELQAEGYKHLFEEPRRQWPRCSMALNWCYNEPWPTAANNNLISWGHIPKPAYYAVRDSLRPQMCSLRFEKLLWTPGETVCMDVFVLNDAPESMGECRVEVFVDDGTGEICLGELLLDGIEALSNHCAGQITFPFPQQASGLFRFSVRCPENAAMDSSYLISCMDRVVAMPVNAAAN